MNVQRSALAHKYAQAYMHLFADQLTSYIIQQMTAFLATYQTDMDAFLYVDRSSFAAAVKRDAFLTLCDQFDLRAPLDRLADVLAHAGRLGFIVLILQEIVALYKQEQGIIDVVVTTAQPLSEQQQQVVQQLLAQKTGKTIQLRSQTDEALIAGMRLQSDTLLWEHSVAQQLRVFSAYAGAPEPRHQ